MLWKCGWNNVDVEAVWSGVEIKRVLVVGPLDGGKESWVGDERMVSGEKGGGEEERR